MAERSASSRPWHQRPMRIGALQCNFEGGPQETLAVADFWAQNGFNVEQLYHLGADGYVSAGDPKGYSDLLCRYLDSVHQAGGHVIRYLNVHVLYAPAVFDCWGQRDAKGQLRRIYDAHTAACMLSPWRDHIMSLVEQTARYQVDGLFLDGPILSPEGCYCEHCRAAFERRYGKPLAPGAPELFDFVAQVKADFVAECYRRFKALRPEGVCYQNLPIYHPYWSGCDLDQLYPYNDIVGSEGGFLFYEPPRNRDVWYTGRTARMLEGCAGGRPTVIFMAADQKPWSWYPHADGETRLISYAAIANGANVWYGYHGATRVLAASAGGRAAKEVTQRLKRLEPVLTASRSDARVAVMFSLVTERFYSSGTVRTDFADAAGRQQGLGDFSGAFQAACTMLARGHVPYDVVFEKNLLAGELKRYQCLVLPSCACLSDELAGIIADYVRGGGGLIAALETGCFDEHGRRRAAGALDELFGVQATGRVIRHSDFDYSIPADHELTAGLVKMFPAPLVLREVRATSARPIVGTLEPLAGRYHPLTGPGADAIFLAAAGKGQVLYLAGSYLEMYASYDTPEFEQIVCRAARRFAPPTIELREAPPSVEMTVRRQEDTGETIVHLVNYSAGTWRPVTQLLPVAGMLLAGTAPLGEAVSMPEGDRLTIHRSANGWQVELPTLKDHLAIRLTPR